MRPLREYKAIDFRLLTIADMTLLRNASCHGKTSSGRGSRQMFSSTTCYIRSPSPVLWQIPSIIFLVQTEDLPSTAAVGPGLTDDPYR
ncbi:hypothetical protein EVAR_16241_1 [Eumeta japonica]|uniref:Uncharacterized protein n=1 Tax=Eumeta variegata TaxID=151549 RepID=A0A4C1U5N3_EUMVA|nr:hypothetical protein EVAR_16241_1 [Eumeta japonica]